MLLLPGEALRGDEQLIPYIPHPVNPTTGALTQTKLKPLDSTGELKFGAAMSDPKTGLHVPITAVTIHPQTGAVLPLAGTHINPVTGLPVAIEIGSMMVDPDTLMPVPILAIALDPTTGKDFYEKMAIALSNNTLTIGPTHLTLFTFNLMKYQVWPVATHAPHTFQHFNETYLFKLGCVTFDCMYVCCHLNTFVSMYGLIIVCKFHDIFTLF